MCVQWERCERICAHAGVVDQDASLFVFSDINTLRRNQLVDFLRALTARLGVDASAYAGHSFRIGGASDLARTSAPDPVIHDGPVDHWSVLTTRVTFEQHRISV